MSELEVTFRDNELTVRAEHMEPAKEEATEGGYARLELNILAHLLLMGARKIQTFGEVGCAGETEPCLRCGLLKCSWIGS